MHDILCFDFIFNISSCSLIQLQDYALRQMERIQQETYMHGLCIQRGCVTSTFGTVFSPVGRGRGLAKMKSIMGFSIIFQTAFAHVDCLSIDTTSVLSIAV